MSYVIGLKCKECGHQVPVSPVHVCEQCFGPYEVEYDYDAMRGRVTRESITSAIWPESDAVDDNLLDAHIANLRQKLESDGERRLIQTVRGIGFVLR